MTKDKHGFKLDLMFVFTFLTADKVFRYNTLTHLIIIMNHQNFIP